MRIEARKRNRTPHSHIYQITNCKTPESLYFKTLGRFVNQIDTFALIYDTFAFAVDKMEIILYN